MFALNLFFYNSQNIILTNCLIDLPKKILHLSFNLIMTVKKTLSQEWENCILKFMLKEWKGNMTAQFN